MPRSGAGTSAAKRCSGSRARWGWHAGPCASMPAPRPSLHGPSPSILDPYLSHLERRLAEGCENGLALWRELYGQGFSGGTRQVHRWLIERRTAPAKTGPHVRRIRAACRMRPSARNIAPALPTVPQLAWLLVQPAAALDAADAATAARVGQDAEAAAVVGLARRFTALVRACGVAGRRDGRAPVDPPAELATWLANARACSAPAIATFAAGLEADGLAVRAALTLPWSSGQAEGQINRIQLLKRQSCGRASFDLLRRRVLMAA
jgi:hypothetical protein